MDDLISRQAAVDALEAKKDKSAKGYVGRFYNTIIQNDIDALKGLPSAQPEPIKISIKDFNKEDWERLKKEWVNTPITVLPAQPERKKGKWLNKGRKICCSVCGRINFCKPNFCDECGADMREEKTDG